MLAILKLLLVLATILLGTACTLNYQVTDLSAVPSTSIEEGTDGGSQTKGSAFADITSSLLPINQLNQSSYIISGNCSYTSSVDIKVNGSSLGTAVCSSGIDGANGSWSKEVNFVPVLDGNLNIQIYDVLSNSSLTSSATILKDTQSPSAALNNIPPMTNSLTLVVSNIVPTDTAEYSYKLGTAAGIDCSSASGYSSFIPAGTALSEDVSFYSDGNLRLCLVAKDSAGNVQSYASATVYNWTKDTTAPTVILSGTPPSPLTNSTSYNITVSGTDVVSYSYKIGLSSVTVCSNTSGYSAEVSVVTAISGLLGDGDGSYRICVIGKNSIGTWQTYASATSSAWGLDTQAPSLAISSPSAGTYINPSNQASYEVTSSCSENGVSVSIRATSVVNAANISGSGTCSAGSVTVNLNLSTFVEGGVNLSASQADSAGNIGTAAIVAVTKDVSAPTLLGTLSDGGYYNSLTTSPNISWGAGVDEVSGVQKYQIAVGTSLGGTQVLGWTDIGNVTSYQVGSLSLNEGVAYYPSVRVIDAAGNVSSPINGNGWIPDVTLPVMASVEDGDQVMSSSYSSWITWTAGIEVGVEGANSGVASYEVRIVEDDGDPVTAWTNVGDVLGYSFTGLSLIEASIYRAEVRAIDAAGNTGAMAQGNGWYVVPQGWKQQAYLKAPNAEGGDYFGWSVAIFGDTIAVGANGEASNQTTITNGTSASTNNSASGAGAVYVFKRTGATWAQEAYIKAPNAGASDNFGSVVSISGDTIVVGSANEDSNQITITNGTSASSDNTLGASGAVYVFKRAGTTWAQEAYIKAPNAGANDNFGSAVSISGDTIAVGAKNEGSNQTTIMNGTTASSDNSALQSGAVYVFRRTGVSWAQEAYIKASNTETTDFFGSAVSISGDTLVVGSPAEDSNQTTILMGTSSADNSASASGAVYVFKRSGIYWAEEAYLKAPNAESGDQFGYAVAIFDETIAVGSMYEDSNQTIITNGTTASGDNSVSASGAVYVFKKSGITWENEAYIKAPNSGSNDWFGVPLALHESTLITGAWGEDSNQTIITNGTTASSDNSVGNSGAAYIFKVDRPATWVQQAYVKAPNAGANDLFGSSVAISGDTAVVGAYSEDSNQTTITNNTTASSNNSATDAGAVYVFKRYSTMWMQEAYLKAPNTEATDQFGRVVDISEDTIVVGAASEDSNQTTITNGTTASTNNLVSLSGAAYVFKRTGTSWAQQAYLKAPNADTFDLFGLSVAIYGDTIAVGAPNEASNQTTITNGTTASSDNSAQDSGAVYVFKRTGTAWSQEAYLKAPNAEVGDYFGSSVAIYGDTIAVGAYNEDSKQTKITNGTTASSDNSAQDSGAVYVFKRTGTVWSQEAYLKTPNSQSGDWFGYTVDISGDTIIGGAHKESSNQTTITNGTTASSDNTMGASGAAYVFKRTGTVWSQEAYLKAPNADDSDYFGTSVAISGDTIIVGASSEDSNQTTISNTPTASSDNSAASAGAAYIFKR